MSDTKPAASPTPLPGLGAPMEPTQASSPAVSTVPVEPNGAAGHPQPVGAAPLPALTPETVARPMTALEMKSRIFSSSNPKSQFKRELIDFMGVTVELRQPSLEMIGRMTKESGEEDKSAAIYILLNYVYVPGTNDRVFDAADEDQLNALPFNESFSQLTQCFNRITGVRVEEERKNS